ncbi:MAG: ABC transporter permease [Gammaproteobacteria bacterium]|jgi:spermidine/putrescine transport system permease protein|nr:ABC transporter permease [Gammaproteobacteria bacterium]
MELKRENRRLVALLTPGTLFLGVFFMGPMAMMIVFSFLEPGLYGGVEWNFYHWNYGRILGWADGEWEEFDPVYVEIFLRSARVALTNVVITLLICYPAAIWVSGLSDRWRTFVVFIITLPFFVSLVVRLFCWVLILRPSGFLNATLLGLGLISEPIDIIYTETAVLIGMAYILLPFMFLPLYASIEKLDHSLIEASSDLGAKPYQTFFRVILPATLPGIAAGAVLVFIPSLGNFIVPDLLGGAKVLMIGNLVEQQFLSARNWPFGSALSVMIMLVMFTLIVIYLRRIGRSKVAR